MKIFACFFMTFLIFPNAFGDAERWEYACSYKDSSDGAVYEMGSDSSLEDANERAKGRCAAGHDDLTNLWNSIMNGNSGCSLQSCRLPTRCVPTDNPNPELRRKGIECEISKLRDAKKVTSIKMNEEIRKKVGVKFGNETLVQLDKVRMANFCAETNALFQITFKQLAGEFSDLMTVFNSKYVPSYAVVSLALKNWAQFSKSANWQKIVGVNSDLNLTLSQENDAALRYEYTAKLIQQKISAQCGYYVAALKPYEPFLTEQSISLSAPDSLCRKAKDKLDEVVMYSTQRRQKLLSASQTLQNSLKQQITALQASEVSKELRQSRAAAAELSSAAFYLAQVNKQISSLWVEGDKDPTYDLPFLAEQYQRIVSFQSSIDQCLAANPNQTWMQTGCLQVQRNAVTTKNYLSDAIPRNIKFGLTIIAQTTPILFTETRSKIKSMLEAGDVKNAVIAYDLLLLTANGVTQ
jgi:hypothetical protein